ncbi:MAG TPA: HDOD domain-containing protein [Candidatus Binatia bacterium]
MEATDPTRAQENVRRYFREVLENRKLPPLPVVVTKVLHMIQDPDLNIRTLSRILSDDFALASRILAASRSAYYGQRILPTTLHAAIQVIGFNSLRKILYTSSTQKLFGTGGKLAQKLWSHSLGVALTTRMLAQRVRLNDPDQAFLAGLLHDVGEMILLHGDAAGFEQMGVGNPSDNGEDFSILEKEQEMFGVNHCFIGRTLLESWNMDQQTCDAISQHHTSTSEDEPRGLRAVLHAADYVVFDAGLGFLARPAMPPAHTMAECGCGTPESLAKTAAEIVAAYQAESALLQV